MTDKREYRGLSHHAETTTAAAMLAPILVAVILLRVWPALDALWVSLTSRREGGGLDISAYIDLLTDSNFLGSLAVTALYSVIVNPLQIAVALALALLFSRRLPAVGVWRTFVLLPIVIPQSISAVIWGVAMRPDGPINGVLQALGLPPQPLLTAPSEALWCIIVIVSWVGVGYWMTFLIAGLQDIPPDIYEAALLDGANSWKRFRYITLPLLRRPLLFVLVTDTVSNFLVFAPVQILTNGGPDGSTDLVMFEIFNRAFNFGDNQGAAAGTVILVLLVMAVVLVQFRMLQSKDVDQ
jgi:multiple sugar transport system permease protein